MSWLFVYLYVVDFVACLGVSALQGYVSQGCMRWISGPTTSMCLDVSTDERSGYTRRIKRAYGSVGFSECYHVSVC